MRFRPSGRPDHPPLNPPAAGRGGQSVRNEPLEHRPQLARGAGQQHQTDRAGRQPETGCGSRRIRQHLRPARNRRLPAIDVRHLQAARRKPRPNRVHDGGRLGKGPVEQLRDDVTRHVVGRRPEPPGDDHDVGHAQRMAQGAGKADRLVAHHQLLDDVDPDRVEPVGDEQRVGVRLVRRQQLGAHGNDRGGRRRARSSLRHPSITAGATAATSRTVR